MATYKGKVRETSGERGERKLSGQVERHRLDRERLEFKIRDRKSRL